MPKQYERTSLEREVKRRLEATRNKLEFSSLSETITYLIDQLPEDKKPNHY